MHINCQSAKIEKAVRHTPTLLEVRRRGTPALRRDAVDMLLRSCLGESQFLVLLVRSLNLPLRKQLSYTMRSLMFRNAPR